MAGENVARPSGEVARVFGLAGVLTDPIRGRVRPDAQCEVARVFGLAGVLTDPIRGRVRPDPGPVVRSHALWISRRVDRPHTRPGASRCMKGDRIDKKELRVA
ncbi:unnamed protein product [Prunus armeniaca]